MWRKAGTVAGISPPWPKTSANRMGLTKWNLSFSSRIVLIMPSSKTSVSGIFLFSMMVLMQYSTSLMGFW